MLLICLALRCKAADGPGLETGNEKGEKKKKVSVAAEEKAPRVWDEAVSRAQLCASNAQVVVITLVVELCSCRVTESCLALNTMDCSMPGFPVLQHLLEFA